ncbi:MAG TPA: DoxX family protein [Polyangia bacterium]|nr:DoxX family protein [Polyangia bacterium]
MRALALDDTTFKLSQASTNAGAPSRARIWTGRVLSGLAALFLAWDGVMKLVQPPVVVEANRALGFSLHALFVVGALVLAFVALYVLPRTAVLGAVLLTAFLGGAVATNVRMGMPLFTHVLFPVYVAALMWGGLYLRDGRVRRVLLPPARR